MLHRQTTYLVDLQIACSDQVLLIGGLGNVTEDVIDGVWNDTAQLGIFANAFHGKRFTSAGLAVGEDGSVEAAEHRINQLPKSLIVEVHLFGAKCRRMQMKASWAMYF